MLVTYSACMLLHHRLQTKYYFLFGPFEFNKCSKTCKLESLISLERYFCLLIKCQPGRCCPNHVPSHSSARTSILPFDFASFLTHRNFACNMTKMKIVRFNTLKLHSGLRGLLQWGSSRIILTAWGSLTWT